MVLKSDDISIQTNLPKNGHNKINGNVNNLASLILVEKITIILFRMNNEINDLMNLDSCLSNLYLKR